MSLSTSITNPAQRAVAHQTTEVGSGPSAGKQIRSLDAPDTTSGGAPSRVERNDPGAPSRVDEWTMTPGLSAAMGLDGPAAVPSAPQIQRKALPTPAWASCASSDGVSAVQSRDGNSNSEALAVQVPMPPGAGAQQAGAAPAGPQSEKTGPEASGPHAAADQVDEPIISNLDSIAPTITYSGAIARGGITLAGSEFGRTDSTPALKNITITQASGVFTVNATYELLTKWDTRKGTGPNGQKNVPDENAAVLTAANYSTAASDLTPNMSDEGGRPPRTAFWAQDLTERHEKVHADDHQKTGKEGLKRALAWIATQTATTKAEVEAHVSAMRSKIVQYIIANGAGSVGEVHAYGDGAPSYNARAVAIKKKGDAGGYP